MSSTHIQSERDSVVSVHTQSITARSSTKNGTRRNLGTDGQSVEYEIQSRDSKRGFNKGLKSGNVSPLEEEEVEVIVLLGEKVSEDAGGIAAADLIRRQREVDALHEVPKLSHEILTEHPAGEKKEKNEAQRIIRYDSTKENKAARSPFGDGWEDEEHPDVNPEHQKDLEDEFSQHGFAEVQGSVDHHGAELDEEHDEERFGDLVV